MTTRPPRQMPLVLPHRPSLGREDYVAGRAGDTALAFIERWPHWPTQSVLLSGPAGSGKSHLVAIWQAASGATMVPAAALAAALPEALAGGAVAIEGIDRPDLHEDALFHLLNLARERKAFVLMTARAPAAGIATRLPDLASRLRAAQPIALAAPDEEQLGRVLSKLFADRQLVVEPTVVAFLLRRMERSFEAAAALVDRLDREALAEGRAVTRTLASAVLADGEGGRSESDAEIGPRQLPKPS